MLTTQTCKKQGPEFDVLLFERINSPDIVNSRHNVQH